MASPRFPKRGSLDDRPTPRWLYEIIKDLEFRDACVDPSEFDFLRQVPPWGRVYCNPPFSRKEVFVQRAARLAKEGYEVLLLLPFDPTTRWFKLMWRNGVTIIVLPERLTARARARYPAALYHQPAAASSIHYAPTRAETKQLLVEILGRAGNTNKPRRQHRPPRERGNSKHEHQDQRMNPTPILYTIQCPNTRRRDSTTSGRNLFIPPAHPLLESVSNRGRGAASGPAGVSGEVRGPARGDHCISDGGNRRGRVGQGMATDRDKRY